MLRNRLWICIIIGWAWSMQAADAPVEKGVVLKSLSVTAAPESMPILKHTLLPRVSEQKKGNAALFYYGALGLMPDMDDELNEQFKQWREQPVDELPRAEVDAFLATFKKSFHQLHLASLRDHCDWHTPIEDGYDLELPSLAAFRQLVRVLALKIRMDLADKDFDAVLENVRQVLAMGRNIAAGPTVIQDLVGMAITGTALRELTAWPKHAQAPNLYWALSVLPMPFIDIRPSMEMEQSFIFREFPALRDLEQTRLSVAQANALVTHILTKTGGGKKGNPSFQALAPAAWAMVQYSDAQSFLQDRRWSQERIKALPVAQAVLIYQVQQYLDIRDRAYCWLFLPYAEAHPHLVEGEQNMSKLFGGKGKFNVFMHFMPALYRIGHLQTRLDRDIAILRTVEALRLEAAHNGGQFPQALSDITRVPIPRDPLTNKPFVYTYSDPCHVRLEGTHHPEEIKKRPAFELTLKP